MTLKTAVLLFCTIAMLLAENNPPQPKADVILVHGNIYTGVAVPSSLHATQRVEALAIGAARVQAVGTENEILKPKGPQTYVISLDGYVVMPGARWFPSPHPNNVGRRLQERCRISRNGGSLQRRTIQAGKIFRFMNS